MDEILEGGTTNNLIAFFYRILTIYFPILALVWTLWVPRSQVSLVFSEVSFLENGLFLINIRAFLKIGLIIHQDMHPDYLLI
jgi:hypothetical protein